TKPHFEEISDAPMQNAVRQIAGGPAKQKSQACCGTSGHRGACDQIPRENSDHGQGTADQDVTSPGRAISNNAEGNAGIFAVHQVDKVVDEFVAPTLDSFGLNGGLADAIQEDGDECEDEPAQAWKMNHFFCHAASGAYAAPSISPSAAEQRSHTLG